MVDILVGKIQTDSSGDYILTTTGQRRYVADDATKSGVEYNDDNGTYEVGVLGDKNYLVKGTPGKAGDNAKFYGILAGVGLLIIGIIVLSAKTKQVAAV